MTFKSLNGESVIVVMDANRNRGNNVDALDWALSHCVRPKDTVIVIGILVEMGGKKTSCFPFYSGIGISAIWERLEFSGQGEMTSEVLEEEISRKREQYQCTLQPFYRQCSKNDVKLEVKLAAGFDPKKITIEEAYNSNTRWIVLDSHLKRHKAFIFAHAGCNVAAMKEKDVATVSLLRPYHGETSSKPIDIGECVIPAVQPNNQPPNGDPTILQGNKLRVVPVSWRAGFPRKFTSTEIKSMTDEFSSENFILAKDGFQAYQGVLMKTPVLVKCFSNDEQFWSDLKILSRIRHRNMSNLVGYCCTDTSLFLIRDFTWADTLDVHLQCKNYFAGDSTVQTR